jgi:hypothetical protein
MRILLLCCVVFSVGLHAQSSPAALAGSNWQRVQALPPHTLVHVSSDKMSRLCVIDSVDEAALQCSAKRVVAASHYTFPRTEVKSVKLTRYVGSTAGGIGIGAGVGLIFGVAVAHNSGPQLIGNGAVWGVTSAAGGIAGGLVGGPTDFLRGPTVYKRP